MLRVLRMARDQGIEACGSPTRTSPLRRDPRERLRATGTSSARWRSYFLAGTGP